MAQRTTIRAAWLTRGPPVSTHGRAQLGLRVVKALSRRGPPPGASLSTPCHRDVPLQGAPHRPGQTGEGKAMAATAQAILATMAAGVAGAEGPGTGVAVVDPAQGGVGMPQAVNGPRPAGAGVPTACRGLVRSCPISPVKVAVGREALLAVE